MQKHLFSLKGFIAIFLLVAVLYTFRADMHPGVSNDESAYGYIPVRSAVFGDWKYPLAFHSTLNEGATRRYPQPLAMQISSWWQKAVGNDTLRDTKLRLRPLSALMMLTLGGLFGWMVYRHSANWAATNMALAVFAFSPMTFYLARTSGIVQEIAFLTGLSFLLPLLVCRKDNPWLSRIIWFASGFLAAFAVGIHLWAAVLFVVLLVSFIACKNKWKEVDGLGTVHRFIVFIIGAAAPIGVVCYSIAGDWASYRMLFAELASLDDLTLKADAVLPGLTYAALSGLFIVSLLLAVGWFTATVLIRQVPRMIRPVQVYAVICIFFAAAYAAWLALPMSTVGLVSQQARHDAMRDMNAATGLDNIKFGDIVIDVQTWSASDGTIRPYLDILRSGQAGRVKGYVLDAEVFAATMKAVGSDAPGIKVLEKEFARNVLRGLIIFEREQNGYYYLMSMRAEDPMLIRFFAKDGGDRKFRASYRDIVPMQQNLSPRWYLLMTTPDVPADFSALGAEDNVVLRYMRAGKGIVSLALIEVTSPTTLKNRHGNYMMFPLTEGWKN